LLLHAKSGKEGSVQQEIASIIEKMIFVQPNGRYKSTDEVLEALRDLAAKSGKTEHIKSRLWSWFKR
jgi:hypothetical protein